MATIGALRRTTVGGACEGRLYAVALGWGGEPLAEWFNDDWANGRFSGPGMNEVRRWRLPSPVIHEFLLASG